MHKTTSKQDYQIFIQQYEKASGLKVPICYLENSEVYIIKKNEKIISGFVLNSNLPLRTTDVFISSMNQQVLNHYFEKSKYCEVCCFWMSREYQKKKIFNAKCWLNLASTIKKQKKEFIIFGTNSRGLANMYGYHDKVLLFHEDIICNKSTFVFMVKRDDFLLGTWKLIFSKVFKVKRNENYKHREILKKTIMYELSE